MPVITLYGFTKKADNTSLSGFCQKLETFLRYTATEYDYQYCLSAGSAPKRKLPYLRIENDSIADSHMIIGHLIANTLSSDPDANLTPSQKADSRAWQAYVEETFYPSVVCERWYVDTNFAIMQDEGLFEQVPWPIKPALAWYARRGLLATMWTQGSGRHSEEETKTIITQAIQNISLKYASSQKDQVVWFHGGEKPTLIDLTLYGFMANCIGTASNPHARQAALNSPGIVALASKLTKQLFPEYKQLLADLDEAEKKFA